MLLFLKNLCFTVFIPGTVAVYLPIRIAKSTNFEPGIALVIPGIFFCLGAAIYIWCLWDFATFGRGTPLPVDAPTKLVVRGLYRYTRNPMYVGVLTIIFGWILLFKELRLAFYGCFIGLLFHSFILLYEEKHLLQEFGAEYDDYRKRVPRWLPGFESRSN